MQISYLIDSAEDFASITNHRCSYYDVSRTINEEAQEVFLSIDAADFNAKLLHQQHLYDFPELIVRTFKYDSIEAIRVDDVDPTDPAPEDLSFIAVSRAIFHCQPVPIWTLRRACVTPYEVTLTYSDRGLRIADAKLTLKVGGEIILSQPTDHEHSYHIHRSDSGFSVKISRDLPHHDSEIIGEIRIEPDRDKHSKITEIYTCSGINLSANLKNIIKPAFTTSRFNAYIYHGFAGLPSDN